MSTIGYSQWYNEATAAIAREAFRRLCAGEHELFLYYKPHGLEFRIVGWNDAHDGYALVTGERIPSNLTVQQLASMFHDLCRRVPVLPGDAPLPPRRP